MLILEYIFVLLLPMIIIIFVFIKSKRIVAVFAPPASVGSSIFNIVGIEAGFFGVHPVIHTQYLTLVPLNVVQLPALACLFIYLIEFSKINDVVLLAIFIVMTTLFEYLEVVSGLFSYGNGWNIFLTFVSYILAYTIAYKLYIQTKKLKML